MVDTRRATLLLVFGTIASTAAQDRWLPSEMEARLAEGLASQMVALGDGKPESRARELAGAREFVQGLRTHLDAWQVKGVVDRAPVFPQLTLPATANPYLGAMQRYQVCTLVLMLQFEDQSEPVRVRRIGAAGMTAFTMAVVYLRQPFAAAGGKDAQIEAFLTSAEFERVNERIQREQAILEHVQTQCGPVMGDLIAGGR